MKRCYLVVGPESAGNRLLASLLVRAGCIGTASTDQQWTPEKETPCVLIRSYPHGDTWPSLHQLKRQLEDKEYEVFTLVTVRHPVALLKSQVNRGHAEDLGLAASQMRQAYIRIFSELSGHFYVVPKESLVLHPREAVRALLHLIGLPGITDGPLVIEGRERHISDENWNHYE